MEYESVRMVSMPESEWVKVEKSAARRELALLTAVSSWSQSPAGETGVAVRPCS